MISLAFLRSRVTKAITNFNEEQVRRSLLLFVFLDSFEGPQVKAVFISSRWDSVTVLINVVAFAQELVGTA